MGRGLPDPPPEVPPEKPAEPYKPITLNGPPAPSVQSCKWSQHVCSFLRTTERLTLSLHKLLCDLSNLYLFTFQTSMKICSVSSASLRSAVPKPRKGT